MPVQIDGSHRAAKQKERQNSTDGNCGRNDYRMTYRLEDYLQNKPMPPELEAAGYEMANEAVRQLYAKHETAGPIEDHDREWLKRLQNEPGYLILMRMLQNIVQRYENSAKLLSQTDPLGNKDALAAAWAYAGIAKLIKEQLEREVAGEIAKI
jgi:hypothetical protein